MFREGSIIKELWAEVCRALIEENFEELSEQRNELEYSPNSQYLSKNANYYRLEEAGNVPPRCGLAAGEWHMRPPLEAVGEAFYRTLTL